MLLEKPAEREISRMESTRFRDFGGAFRPLGPSDRGGSHTRGFTGVGCIVSLFQRERGNPRLGAERARNRSGYIVVEGATNDSKPT
jgi:hypothetical protein